MRLTFLRMFSSMLSGCSILFLEGAPAPDQWNEPEAKYAYCDDSGLWPILDGLQVLGGIGGAVLANDPQATNSLLGPDDPLPFVITGIVYAAISGYGFSVTNECTAFKEHQKVLREQARYRDFFTPTTPQSAAAPTSNDSQILQ